VIEDIVMAAFGGARSIGSRIEAELRRMGERGDLKPDELEAILKDVHKRLEARAAHAREVAAPVVGIAADAIRRALDIPSRGEIETLVQRLEKATAALEKAQKREGS
jgi:hypothetical protein